MTDFVTVEKTHGDDQRSLARRYGIGAIEMLAAGGLTFLVFLMLAGVVARYVFSSPLIYGDELGGLVFVWISMLGSVLAIDRSEHLRLTLFVDRLPPVARDFAYAFGNVIVAAFLVTILPAAFEYMESESFLTMPALGISGAWRVASLGIGIALMILVLADFFLRTTSFRNIVLSVLLFAAIVGACWLLKPVFMELGRYNILIFLVGVLLFCLFLGVPIAFCFGAAVVSFLLFSTRLPISVVVGRMDEGMGNLILLSVPVFVLLGGILDQTRMGKSIVDFLASLIGHIKGGMSYVLLGSLYLVSGISGSKVSDMATVAPALFPEMEKRGGKRSDMVALLATGAIMADTVPPSIILIVIGSVAGVSIAALFTSGFVVALWLLLILAAAARWKARKENMEGVRRPSMNVIGTTLLLAAPALVLPFLIRIAVGEGIATATEVSTVAVVYAYLVGQTIYGRISGRQTYRLLVDTATMTGAIMIIIGTASAGAWALTQTGFSQIFGTMMTGLPGGWVSYMLVTILLFIVLGCMLEGLPAIVLLAPIMFPIAGTLGIHPVHYAMVVVVSMNIGMFIPPVGIMYYIACSIGRVSPTEPIRSVIYYLGMLVLALVALALVPALSIGLL